MNRWLQRARELEEKAPGRRTDKTDRTRSDASERDLSSVLAPPRVGPFDASIQLLSVSSVRRAASPAMPSLDRGDWYSRGWLWDDLEIQTFVSRHRSFQKAGLAAHEAERVAERLIVRDREADHRHLCVECRHGQPGLKCSRGLAALSTLHACDRFVPRPTLVHTK